MNEIIYYAADAAIKQKLSVEQFIEVFKKDPSFYCFEEGELVKFVEIIVGHCSECVRDVLRSEDSELTYGDADKIQKRMKQFFGIGDWSTNEVKV